MAFPGGRISGDITPSNTGQDLGDASHKWDLYGQDVHVSSGIRTDNSSNTDICGIIAISVATTGTYTFANTYVTAPIVTVTPTSDPTAVGVWWVTVTTTAITVHVATLGTISFNYTCIART